MLLGCNFNIIILFWSKYKIKSNPNLNITCNGSVIENHEPTTSVKYLGATIDQSLSFDAMACSILKKANARLKFLYRKYLTQQRKKPILLCLYFNIIMTMPVLYGTMV